MMLQCTNVCRASLQDPSRGTVTVLLVVLLLFTGLYAAPTNNEDQAPSSHSIQRRSYSRQLCLHHQGSTQLRCSYHDTCIESLYQCGSTGLSIGYSQPRCKAVLLMRPSNSTCSHCLSSRPLVNWILQTERCFQSKIISLAQERRDSNKTTSSVPDPQQCLSFEEQGLRLLNSCYKKGHQSLCTVLSTYSSNNAITSDFTKLINALSISDYYKPLIKEQFRDLISGCGRSELANQIAPLPSKRVLFCVVESKPVPSSLNITVSNWISEMSQVLQQPLNQFSVANRLTNDDRVNDKCRRSSSPNAGVALRDEYRLIQWIPTVAINQLREYYSVSLRAYKTNANLIFFGEIIVDSCGNGIREAGEECDQFGETGIDSEAPCNEECKIESGYECITDQLTLTQCNVTVCGDGKRTSDESCDDGNVLSGDGCSFKCTIEHDYTCTRDYHKLSDCKLLPQPSSTSTTLPSSSSTVPILPLLSSSPPPSSPSPTPTILATPPVTLGVTSSSCIVRTSLLSVMIPLLIGAGYLLIFIIDLR